MRKIRSILQLFACIMFLFLNMACSAEDKANIGTEHTEEYFSLEDFQDIVLDETTLFNFNERYLRGGMQITSYGGFCDYPTEDGGYIRIKFYGSDMIVGSVEYISAAC